MNRKWAAGFTRTQRLYQLFCVISFNDGPRTTHRVAMYLSALFGSISSFYPWYLLWYHRTILFLLIIHLFFFKKANGEGDEPQNFLQESRNGEKKRNVILCGVLSVLARRWSRCGVKSTVKRCECITAYGMYIKRSGISLNLVCCAQYSFFINIIFFL